MDKTDGFLIKFVKLEKEIENMCFNSINNISEFVDGNDFNKFISDEDNNTSIYKYYDKLYKKTREQTQEGTENIHGLLEELKCSLNDEFLTDFYNKSDKEGSFYMNCASAYFNCGQLAKTFLLYFYISNYHIVLYDVYGDALFRIVYKTMISFDQKEIISFFKEISTDGKMLNFFIELHTLIMEDIDDKILQEIVQYENNN